MLDPARPAVPTLRQILARAHRRVIAFAILMAGVPLIVGSFMVIQGYAERNLVLIANSASYAVEPAVVFGDIDAIRAGMISVAAVEDVKAIEVWDSRRRLLARWEAPAPAYMSRFEKWGSSLLWPSPVIHPVRHRDIVIAEIRVYGGMGGIGRYLLFGVCIAVAGLGATFLATQILARRLQNGVVHPLIRFAEVAHTVRAQRRFDRRVPPAGIAEIDQLGRDFNILLAELDGWQIGLTLENEKLARQATHDGLTGLGNRLLFERKLAETIDAARAQGEVFALLYLDANDFKNINDHHGHDAGDAILRAMATRLRASIRQGDSAFRLGGDEFTVIIAPPVDRTVIENLMSRISAAVEMPVPMPGGMVLSVSLSIGFALYPDDGSASGDLVRLADAAMYRHKRRRRTLNGDRVT